MKHFLLIAIFIINLEAGILDFKSLQSDFVQTITNDENSTITYTGTFYATAASQALWIYQSPIKKSVYFDGNHVAIVEPELEQVIMTTLRRSPNLTQIIADAKKINHDTYKATYENTDYFIDIKTGTIQDIRYKDKLDNHVIIHLKNLQKNIILDRALFHIKIPTGYDVIDQ